METKIRKIGNSSGVVISKSILVASKISDQDKVRISVDNGRIVIEKSRNPREGWEERFLVAREAEETFFPENLSSKFDKEEWTWE
ncbi:MAG: AbrB/MazE/SpoVT family DNA-binding domain-containing protein [Sphingobacterium sp.]|uniref:AbrB/MazE/SpoVT family DNA-binding domain-containing protein n=1 Tax=Sphingobacterium sp. JB170 TaxID=1434842 RepID=UPI00097EEC8A|nr:hypothetical protein [Sphingobacterium sp. JB170]SJN27053.1 hypothetical protein FM107_05195 [Sphingobacterium sp. JB170]